MNIDTLKPVWRVQARRLFLAGAAASALALAACSGSDGSGAPAAVAAQMASVQGAIGGKNVGLLKGTAHGGNQPVAWSLITLYAAGNSGYGSANAVGYGYSDENGNITAIYSCPSSTTQIYLVASGGNAGGGYNTAIGLSAPLGPCGSLSSVSATVDEVTTVASAYALSQFLDPTGQQPGTSAGNAVGLNNAVAVFGNLASLSGGTAQTAPVSGASGTVPTAAVNTLADILAACVVTSGASSSACSGLFSAATPSGGTAPASTLQAVLDIARNPGANVAALYALAGTSGPFQPQLTAAPADWNLAIDFKGGDLASTGPRGIAIDAQGNAWVAAFTTASTVNSGHGAVIELGPTGVPAGTFIDNGNVYNPEGIAVDASGNVWAANIHSATTVNNGLGSVTGLSATGTSLGGSPYSGTGLSRATALAVDGSGNIWLANTSGAFELQQAAGYTGVNYPVADGGSVAPQLGALAIDNAGNVWLPDSDNSLLVELNSSGQQAAGSPYSGFGLHVPLSVAVDASGNVWTANSGAVGVGVSELVAGTSGYTGVSYTGNEVSRPATTAIDGAGNVWISNVAGKNAGVVELAGNGSTLSSGPATGMYASSGLFTAAPQGVAIDASGNVWIGGSAGGNVVELVGAAKPVKTPVIGEAQLP